MDHQEILKEFIEGASKARLLHREICYIILARILNTDVPEHATEILEDD